MTKENCKDMYCEYNNFKRARYFHGMLMTDRDFTEEQKYHIGKRKLHNRMVHGCGVVCGLRMAPGKPEGNSIIIEPGLAIDCQGNEIYVQNEYAIDIIEAINSCIGRGTQRKEDCPPAEVAPESNKWYVVIRYREIPSDAVPVYAPGSSCEEKICEYSRIREGFCIKLTDRTPCSVETPQNPCYPNQGEGTQEDELKSFYCQELLMPCPGACCDEPEIVLGSITFPGPINRDTKIVASMINNCDCRKFVMTFGLLQYWMKMFSQKDIDFGRIAGIAFRGTEYQLLNDLADEMKNACEEYTAKARSKKTAGKPK